MVTATGTYDPAKQVLVPGRLHDGKTGYWVVSAFAVDGAPTLNGVGCLAPDLDPGGPRLGGRRRRARPRRRRAPSH